MPRLLAMLLLALPALAGAQPGTYTNPVIAGDHPDPSVIRVGSEYWATATTSQWAPVFPLLRSTDLVNWTLVGAVFETPPDWSEGSYWAPEIDHHEGRFSIFYTARKKDGPLCVAVATATQPAGPYTDHGPMVCQEVGSIDAVAITDEDGQRHLVWKEDGNSRKLPTPLWAQRLDAGGITLVGERHELLRNEAPWEGHLIEGPFIVGRNGWLYMFYSAGACCGRTCDYRLGVARARALLGPWERNPANPILAGNEHWRCPGHGSIVTDPRGRDFLLYHAYHPNTFEYAGRQALLDEVTWDGEGGWPRINGGRGPSDGAAAPLGVPARKPDVSFSDEFTGASLAPGWQWPWDRTPERRLADGSLVLRASGRDAASAVDTIVARPALTGDYVVTTRVLTGRSRPGTMAGLSIYGNAANAIGISVADGRAIAWRRQKNAQQSLAAANVPHGDAVHLRITARNGARFEFAMSPDGQQWRTVGDAAEGGHLPPWDLAVRIGLVVGGPAGSEASFDWLRVEQAPTSSDGPRAPR
jgi:xylan 1,4-beta-xylosidase